MFASNPTMLTRRVSFKPGRRIFFNDDDAAAAREPSFCRAQGSRLLRPSPRLSGGRQGHEGRGNAIDAAVATSLALGVVAPAFSGIGGGGFLLVRLRDSEALYVDYREVAPGAARPGMFELDSQGEPVDFANSMGYRSAAVPGTVAGLTYGLERFGRLKFREVAAPAIEYARKGFAVSPLLGYIMSNNVDNASLKFRRSAESSRNWLKDGRTYTRGREEGKRGPRGLARADMPGGQRRLLRRTDSEVYRRRHVEERRPDRGVRPWPLRREGQAAGLRDLQGSRGVRDAAP